MQLHISPSLRHVTVLPSKGVKEFIKVKVVSRRLSYHVLVYSLLAFMLFRFTFLLTAVNTIHEESKCSGIGKSLTPRLISNHYGRNEISSLGEHKCRLLGEENWTEDFGKAA